MAPAGSGKLPFVQIFTDGACKPNPGLGGWAAILVSPAHGRRRREIRGAEADSTNNRMELTAAIRGLQALRTPCRVRLATDSKYLSQAFHAGWLEGWKHNGWKTVAKTPVKNQDLWRELDRLCGLHTVEWVWVKAHSTHRENNRADELAVAAREQLRASSLGRRR